MLKILHMADIHARDHDLAEIEKCLDHIVETAQADAPDLIINAGDTFDSQNVKLDSKAAKLIFKTFSRLADIAPVAIVIGTPSHDGLAAEVLRHVRAQHQVWVSAKPEQYLLIEQKDGRRMLVEGRMLTEADTVSAVISMIPTPTKQFFNTDSDIQGSDAEIAHAMNGIFGGLGQAASVYCGVHHILVGHFQVGGAFISETQQLTGRDIEIHRDQLALAEPDLVCLGHIHKEQRIGANAFYSGSIYRKDFGEMDRKGFYIHELENGEVNSRFIETPTRKLMKIEADFTQPGSDFGELDSILYTYGREELTGAFIRVEFKVYQDEAGKLDREAIEDFFGPVAPAQVDVRIIRIPRENVRSERIMKLHTLREKLTEMAALKGETVPESILAKADQLESIPAEQVLAAVGQIGGAA